MKVIAVIDDEEVIYRILSHLKLLSPGDGPRAPPRGAHSSAPSLGSNVPRELIYEPFLLTSASAAGTVPRRGPDLGSTTPGEARRWPLEPRSGWFSSPIDPPARFQVSIGPEWRRTPLAREVVTLQTSYGAIPFKVSRLQGRVVTVTPEFADVVRIAREKSLPVREVLEQARADGRRLFRD